MYISQCKIDVSAVTIGEDTVRRSRRNIYISYVCKRAAMLSNLFKCCCAQQAKEAEISSPDSEEPELQSQGSFSGGFRRGSKGGSRRGSTRSSTPSYTSDSAEVSDVPAIRPTEIVPTEESPVRAITEPIVSKTKTKTKVKKTGHFWSSKSE